MQTTTTKKNIFAILPSQDKNPLLHSGSQRSSAATLWTGAPARRPLADLLQQFVLLQFKLHADGHFCHELVAALLGHLFAVAQVDQTDVPAAFEEGQRLVRHPVTGCGGETSNHVITRASTKTVRGFDLLTTRRFWIDVQTDGHGGKVQMHFPTLHFP